VFDPVWRWECQRGYCQKVRVTNETKDTALSLSACRLFCGSYGNLWPKPTGEFNIGNYLVHLNINSMDISAPSEAKTTDLILSAWKRFTQQIAALIPSGVNPSGGRSLLVNFIISNTSLDRLTWETDESYNLTVKETSDGRINATIMATNFFGARHGLETLNQLVIFDDLRDEVQIARDVFVSDKPAYPHRGILLDTSRSYIPVTVLKRTFDGMASSKLNTFHWHITDSHSFPYVSKSQPALSRLGAYSPRQVYTESDIEELLVYAKARGIRVIPEFDAPAHVGEGWQDTSYVACFNKQPWQNYCVEPPCGQLDPTQDGLYDILEDIYSDMINQFQPDVFHMGGDEVSLTCWNTTENIVSYMQESGWNRTEADFVKLWDIFQSKALERLYKNTQTKIPIIMWTSTLTKTDYVEQYLPNDTYVIQIWTLGTDKQISDLLERGYRLILSNYDALYLDCGFAGWVTDGNNWCSPYIGWQKVYENSPAELAGDRSNQILGAEAALWTEQADGSSVDSRLWPRAAAMAERLWAEPNSSWRDAETRMLVQRERLVLMGIGADALEPQWCLQNEENCPIGGEFNVE
ncbi:chitooligosaccharidolytic beta-N-acetylglucosaminidase, partial [Rhyzopertha dominica]